MDAERQMYSWRRMTPEQRVEALTFRQRHRLPWHSPPHYEVGAADYMITAACYEHRAIIGARPERMAEFEAELIEAAKSSTSHIFAWTILPNHYHLLVNAPEIVALLQVLGRL